MLPKNHRLPRKDVQQVKKFGKIYKHPLFTIISSHQPPHIPQWQVCIITSTKLAKRAVVRNRLRRQIYKSIKTHPPIDSIQLIIIPKTPMLNLNDEEISLEIHKAISNSSSVQHS